MLKGIAAGLIVAFILGMIGWLAGGVLIESLEGVTRVKFDTMATKLDRKIMDDKADLQQVQNDIATLQNTIKSLGSIVENALGGALTIQSDGVLAVSDPSGWIVMGDGSKLYSIPIVFKKQYKNPPKVIVAVSQFELMSGGDSQYIQVSARNVLQFGFLLHFRVLSGSKIPNTEWQQGNLQ